MEDDETEDIEGFSLESDGDEDDGDEFEEEPSDVSSFWNDRSNVKKNTHCCHSVCNSSYRCCGTVSRRKKETAGIGESQYVNHGKTDRNNNCKHTGAAVLTDTDSTVRNTGTDGTDDSTANGQNRRQKRRRHQQRAAQQHSGHKNRTALKVRKKRMIPEITIHRKIQSRPQRKRQKNRKHSVRQKKKQHRKQRRAQHRIIQKQQ